LGVEEGIEETNVEDWWLMADEFVEEGWNWCDERAETLG
jgi:hypothetical protein